MLHWERCSLANNLRLITLTMATVMMVIVMIMALINGDDNGDNNGDNDAGGDDTGDGDNQMSNLKKQQFVSAAAFTTPSNKWNFCCRGD